MRGKDPKALQIPDESGITPAYAGKRGKGGKAGNSPQDHPRLCGEKAVSSLLTLFVQGSPPPMRGKAVFTAFHLLSTGITPAYAGKRFPERPWHDGSQDHPRLCGEKSA